MNALRHSYACVYILSVTTVGNICKRLKICEIIHKMLNELSSL